MAYENSAGLNVTNQYGPRTTGGARGVYEVDGYKNEFVVDGVDVGIQYVFPRGDGIRVYYIDKTFAVGTITSIKIGGIEVNGATDAAPVRLYKENVGTIVVTGMTGGKLIIGYKNVAGDKDLVLPAFPPYKDQIVTSVSVTSATMALGVGATGQISALALPASAPQAFDYVSADPTKATVSALGVVTGVAAGTSVVTVRAAGDYTKTATVTVTVS
jgi:uncharacterized protein YjdB